MTLKLHDPVNGDGLFDVQGKAFHALAVLAQTAATTIPAEIEDFLQQFYLRADAQDLDVAEAMEGLATAVSTWQSAAASLASQVRTNLEDLLIELVAADAAQPEASLVYSLEYLIEQMLAGGHYVEANTISLSLAADAGNVGDLAIAYTERRADGQVNQNCLAETIALSISDVTGPTVRFRAPQAATNRLAHDWPKGSGADLTLTATDPANSLVANGDFEDVTIADIPDDWIVHVGTPGTTVKVTAPEVQTVTRSGSPTGGSWRLLFVDPHGITRSTDPLAYNASGATVQSALRELPDLAEITVSTTGTSPDYTHTITFHGATGDPPQLTSVNNLTGGTSPAITHATTTPGSPGAYRGRALEFDSDGVELTAVYQPLELSTETVYFCHFRVKRVGATLAGELRVEIVDGIDGSVIQDSAGNSAALVLDATAISTTSHESRWFSFRLPATINLPVYLRIRISAAIDNTASIYFDEVAIEEGTALYTGGPYVAVFDGALSPGADDAWTLTVTNDRGGQVQEWYNRVFGMADNDLLLPVSGTALIADSVIS